MSLQSARGLVDWEQVRHTHLFARISVGDKTVQTPPVWRVSADAAATVSSNVPLSSQVRLPAARRAWLMRRPCFGLILNTTHILEPNPSSTCYPPR